MLAPALRFATKVAIKRHRSDVMISVNLQRLALHLTKGAGCPGSPPK